MSSRQYVVTAQKATAVSSCATGYFTSPTDLNLMVAKSNWLELYVVTPKGLQLLKEITINGNVCVMKFFWPKTEKKGLLFLLTDKYDIMILETIGERDSLEIKTKAHGKVPNKAFERPLESGIKAIIDPESQVIGLRVYEGILLIIPLKNWGKLEVGIIRMESFYYVDVEFLYGCPSPTVVLIVYGKFEIIPRRHVRTHEISVRDMKFVKGSWTLNNIDAEASLIISVPAPFGGAIIVGREKIYYHNGTNCITASPPVIRYSKISCYSRADSDGFRYLLGDMSGRLFLLILEHEEKIDGTKVINKLGGEVSIPKCIACLDNGVVFIGSKLGDSQLIKINAKRDPETNSCISVIETINNIAPIEDMIVVDLEKTGTAQLITCSGALEEGSLRILTPEIGIEQHGSIGLQGITGMWPLKMSPSKKFDNTLVLSFVQQTKVLSLNGDDVGETEIAGFQSDCQTFFCGNVGHSQVLQITSASARLVSTDTKKLIYEWKPHTEKNISVVAGNKLQVLCASGIYLYYLEIGDKVIDQKAYALLEYQVACLDISLLDAGTEKASIAAVGLWTDQSARILKLPLLNELYKEFLEIMPRSILATRFDRISYLFCALGDGSLLYFIIDMETGILTEKKKDTLGTRPAFLKSFVSSTKHAYVIACSDRPTKIHSSNQKLVFSNLSLKEVNYVCSLHTRAYPDSLALSNDTAMTIGKIDKSHKLHIRTVPLGESPRKITYQETTQSFGIITMRMDVTMERGLQPARHSASTMSAKTSSSVASNFKNVISARALDTGQMTEIYKFLVVDQHKFEVQHSYQLMPWERALSLVSARLGYDPRTYYIVGTAFVNPEEIKSKAGRILVFLFEDRNLTLVYKMEIDGACICLLELNGKLFADINSTMRLFEWTQEEHIKLLKARGDFNFVDNLLLSMNLLQHKTIEGNFEEIAFDYYSKRILAVEFLDKITFVGGDNIKNLFVCQIHSEANKPTSRIIQCGQFHLGDKVKVFQRGSLTKHCVFKNSLTTQGCALFGTENGSIGLVAQVNLEFYYFLLTLQRNLITVIKSVGEIDHSYWRRVSVYWKTKPCENFIDGDIIERFLDLPWDAMLRISKNLQRDATIGSCSNKKLSVPELINIVENLARIH